MQEEEGGGGGGGGGGGHEGRVIMGCSCMLGPRD